jgi:hypothetical protein
VNKLERVKEVLEAKSDIAWMEEEAELPYHRSRSGYYWFNGIRIAPKDPLLDVSSLMKFSQDLIRELIPIEPASISHCYLFPARRPAIRLGTLYFLEETQNDMESKLAVSIYPCETMSKDVGYRAIIEIGGYECPEPCNKARKCRFKISRYRFLTKMLQP